MGVVDSNLISKVLNYLGSSACFLMIRLDSPLCFFCFISGNSNFSCFGDMLILVY